MKLVPLSQVCQLVNGGTPKSGIAEYWGGDVAWLTPAEMGKLDTPAIEATVRTITEAGLRNSSAKQVPVGAVIMSTRAPIGHLAIPLAPMAFNQGCRGLVPSKALDTRYLYYFLCFSREALNELGTGTTFKELSSSALGAYKIPLPPIEEQQRIVLVLDEAFAAIATATANAEKNLANTRELFNAWIKDAIGRSDNQDSRRARLGDLTTKIGSGATPRGGKESYLTEGIPLVRSLNVHDRHFKPDQLAYLDQSQARQLAHVTLQRGDVLLNITGASVARCCLLPEAIAGGRVNQHVAIIRPKRELLDPKFLELLLTSPLYKERLLGVGDQGGSTRQAITKAEIQEFEIGLPPLEAQRTIVALAQEVENETLALADISHRKAEALTTLKQSLLHRAFSGELTG